jgi:hypothetical protein
MFRLNERAGGPASPAGRDRANRQAAQNQKNKDNKSLVKSPAGALATIAKPTPKTREVLQRRGGGTFNLKPSAGKPEMPNAMDRQREAAKKMAQPKQLSIPTKKETQAPKTAGQSKPMNTPAAKPKSNYASVDAIRDRKFQDYKADRADRQKRQAATDKRNAESRDKSDAKDNLEKRKSGIFGGVKSALGGDVIGMGGRRNEPTAEKEARKEMNKRAKADFTKKKVQQTGNLAKNVVGRGLDSGKTGDPTSGGGTDPQGTGKAKSWGTK